MKKRRGSGWSRSQRAPDCWDRSIFFPAVLQQPGDRHSGCGVTQEPAPPSQSSKREGHEKGPLHSCLLSTPPEVHVVLRGHRLVLVGEGRRLDPSTHALVTPGSHPSF